jgi:hypothetical protein
MAFDFTNPYGMPNLGPVTPQPQPTQTPNPMGGGKNDKLALMLYALGGALKGDKNFVQNTMQLQNIQDAKKREKEMKENWQKALGNLEGSINPTLLELARVVGPEKGAGLVASGLSTGTKDSVERFSIFSNKAGRVIGSVLKTDAEGIAAVQADPDKQIAPLSAPSGEKAGSIEILQMVDANDNFIRNITERDFVKEQQAGTLPKDAKLTRLPTDTKTAQTKTLTKSSDIFISPEIKPYEKQYDATIQLVNAIQSTADKMYEEPTAALAAGGLFQFVDALEQNVSAVIGEYAKQNPDVNADYNQQQQSGTFIAHDTKRDFGERIKEISGGNAVLESKIRDLAYLFAASRGQEGRGLSDKDYENALNIVSGGVGAKGRIQVLEEVANRISGDVTLALENQKARLNYRSNLMPERQEDFNKYVTEIESIFATPIPTFVNPYMQQQIPATQTTGGPKIIKRTLPTP